MIKRRTIDAYYKVRLGTLRNKNECVHEQGMVGLNIDTRFISQELREQGLGFYGFHIGFSDYRIFPPVL